MSENGQSSERKNRTGKSNQPPQPEFCRPEGQAEAPLEGVATEQPAGGVNRDSRGPQAGVAPRLCNSASKDSAADGDGVISPEPNTNETASGEVSGGLPGSKSVAREEGVVRNLRGPEPSRRSNCGNQAGRTAQRQEEQTDGVSGVRSVHSSPGQGHGPDPGEGADTTMQSAQETSAVRPTESSWRTSLRAIARKAVKEPHHRFGGLYRLLNEASLKECFLRLRKDAAPGVDGMCFAQYAQHLDENVADLVQRLKNQSYRAGFRWGKSRKGTGRLHIQRRTSRKKLRGAVKRFTEWIREQRAEKVGELMKTVARKYRGHWNYYGIIGNSESLWTYFWATGCSLFKWLNRRSPRRSFTWPGFRRLLERYRVPPPRIMETAPGNRQPPSRHGATPEAGAGVNLLGAHYVPSRA